MNAAGFLWILIALPPLGAGACLACRSRDSVTAVIRAGVLLWAAAALVFVREVRAEGSLSAGWGWIHLDALSAYHLLVMTAVFTLSSLYLPAYFRGEPEGRRTDPAGMRRFGALWFGALAAMTLVLLSDNIGILWVGIEATTLVTAFLICTHRTPESMEAMWKYLIICSVGVAFAFMGTLFAGAAASGLHCPASQALLWTCLNENAARLDPVLMKVAFLFLLVGYGTKAGIAPMHSWLPDAHSQAPAPVSALFSGFMLNAALYAVMRYMPLVEAATGNAGWSHRLLLFFGLASLLTAAAFIASQRDLKRLLAYCSIEHIGIIAIGLGLGGLGTFAALLHTLNHSLAKSLAFFAAGRLGQMHGTHDMHRLAGSLKTAPVWGGALLVSLLALVGAAPFAVFMSELLLLFAAAGQGAHWTLGLFLAGAAAVFVGILRNVIPLAWGDPAGDPRPERAGMTEKLLVAVCLGALLLLGLWLPRPLTDMLAAAVRIVEGAPLAH